MVNFAGNGNSFSAEIEPADDGVVQTIVDGEYQDPAGNNGEADTAVIAIDRTPPQMVIDGPTAIYSGDPAGMTYHVSEPVTGFDNQDITVSNGSSVNFVNQGDTLFSSTITGAAPGQTVVSINETGYTDLAGNEGLPVEEFLIDILTGDTGGEITGLQVYPNPAGKELNVSAAGFIVRIVLTDTNGHPLTDKSYDTGTYPSESRVELSGLPPGLYNLHITTADGRTATVKIVKR